MTGFELRTSGIGIDRSTNWATTTARNAYFFKRGILDKKYLMLGPLFVGGWS